MESRKRGLIFSKVLSIKLKPVRLQVTFTFVFRTSSFISRVSAGNVSEKWARGVTKLNLVCCMEELRVRKMRTSIILVTETGALFRNITIIFQFKNIQNPLIWERTCYQPNANPPSLYIRSENACLHLARVLDQVENLPPLANPPCLYIRSENAPGHAFLIKSKTLR